MLILRNPPFFASTTCFNFQGNICKLDCSLNLLSECPSSNLEGSHLKKVAQQTVISIVVSTGTLNMPPSIYVELLQPPDEKRRLIQFFFFLLVLVVAKIQRRDQRSSISSNSCNQRIYLN